jgi:hypothetical protein
VIYMYARVCMQSLTLIDQVVVEIFEVVERWVVGDVWVRVSTQMSIVAPLLLFCSKKHGLVACGVLLSHFLPKK